MTNLLLNACSKWLILSWDPSQLISIREYELGFQGCLCLRGYMAVYIGWSVNREPLDQTDLTNDVDWISMAVGESSSKRADK
jgi:hypothetical protein